MKINLIFFVILLAVIMSSTVIAQSSDKSDEGYYHNSNNSLEKLGKEYKKLQDELFKCQSGINNFRLKNKKIISIAENAANRVDKLEKELRDKTDSYNKLLLSYRRIKKIKGL